MIKVDNTGDAVITCSEYDETITITGSSVVSRIHFIARGEDSTALVTMSLAELIELRDHLNERIKYAV